MLDICETCGALAGKICKNMKTGRRKKTPHEDRQEVIPSVSRPVMSSAIGVRGLIQAYLGLDASDQRRVAEIVRCLDEGV